MNRSGNKLSSPPEGEGLGEKGQVDRSATVAARSTVPRSPGAERRQVCRIPHRAGGGGTDAWKIHALSLSGRVRPDRLAAGAARLTELGSTVTSPDAATATWRYFAGTDDERLAALDASLNSDADVVMFTRGGYGLSRLLHRIDWQTVAASRKLFCGYSDITAFNLAALAQANYLTFSGPMLASDFAQTDDIAARDFTEANFFGLLRGEMYAYPECVSDTEPPTQTINGTLWGTNLSMIANLVGTPHMPKIDDGILVLEDVAEEPYRIERMFWQLKHAGILDRQRAIILAEFSDCEPTNEMRYPYSMIEVIETLRDIAPCPVLTGFPFGHVPAKVTLPIGASASVAIDGARYVLSVRDYLK